MPVKEMYAKMRFFGLLLVLLSTSLADAAEAIDDEEQDSQDHPVVDIPDFVTSSSRVRVKLGEMLKLTCQLNNNPSSVPLMWLKQVSSSETTLVIGGKVTPKYKNRIRVRTIDGNKGESLTMDSVTADDAGHYECRIMDVVPKKVSFEVKVTDEELEDDEEFEDEEVEVKDASGNAAAAAQGVNVVTHMLSVWCLISLARLHLA